MIFAAPELQVLPGDRVSLQRFGRDNPGSQHILHFAVAGRRRYMPRTKKSG